MSRLEDMVMYALLGGVALFIVGLVVFLVGFTAIAVTGSYSYDYRCRDGIREERLNVLSVPVSGWDPMGGSAVIGCSEGEVPNG